MEAVGARRAGAAGAGVDDRETKRTPAQWFSYIVGAVLILAGIAGFFADATFDSGNLVDGDTLLGLEVNGFHNVVHIASGLLLLLAAPKRATAKAVALAVGATYVVVTAWGVIDGNDVFRLIPVNTPDEFLHGALAAGGLLTGLISRGGPDTGRGRGAGAADAPRTVGDGR